VKLVTNGRNGSLPLTMVGPHLYGYGLVGQSRAIGEVIRRIELVSASCSTVLIRGETGTGKELVDCIDHF
jgi:transcriptional regulator with GAF, ATPase, and Fis domain